MGDLKKGEGAFAAGVVTTARKDWDHVVAEIFARLIGKSPFALGVVAREKTLLGATVRYRFNPGFATPKAGEYVRRSLTDKNLDTLFSSGTGLAPADIEGVYKVVGDEPGLPKNSLICRVASTVDARFRAVVIYGGERLEGQLESRLKHLRDILSGARKTDEKTTEDLVEELKKLNLKRLFDYDMQTLNRIANGLDHEKDNIDRDLKPKLKTVNDFILSKNLKR
ncbi:MAG: hypothetical protein OEW39_11545 [Deltaproteobacteria bacterium]|nr:hypothetical protein [Deltaproteobacteria bacterium]